MRIIDCFPYFNEKELLELRINILHDKVDKFIICDANKTHKGTPKPFSCKNTLQELGIFSDKIQVVEVNLPSYEEEPNAWVRERAQRNAAASLIRDDDIFIVGDCDEIINSDFVDYYVNVAKQNPNNILRIPMIFLNGRGDLRVYDSDNRPVSWKSAFLCMKHHLQKYTLSDIRESHALCKNNIEYPDIFTFDNGVNKYAGWHFSWMGDSNRMKQKCESFLHWDEVSVEDNYIPEEGSNDPLGRKNHMLKYYNINSLPSKLFELERVRDFLFPKESWKIVNYTEKYKIKMKYNQFGHFVEENFYDKTEDLCYKLFEKNVLDIQRKNKKTFNMIELGSNYSYYSMLFKKILEPKETFNLLLEPYGDYMKQGKEHFEMNNLNGVFLNERIANLDPNYNWNNITFDCPSTSIDELLMRYDIDDLDVLHSDIDGTEIYMLDGAKQSLKNKKIDLLVIMTHAFSQEEEQNSLYGTPTRVHTKCKEILSNYDYDILYDHPESDLGCDGMLIFKRRTSKYSHLFIS